MTEIEKWAKIYDAGCTREYLAESVDKDEVIANIVTSLMYFLNGEGDKVLKDQEWMNYIVNDINNAVFLKIFKLSPEDERRFEEIKSKIYDSEDTEG